MNNLVWQIVGSFLGPDYRFLGWTASDDSADTIFGKCEIYGTWRDDEWLSTGYAKVRRLKYRYRRWYEINRNPLAQKYSCVLPSPFNMGARWHSEAQALIAGKQWSQMIQETEERSGFIERHMWLVRNTFPDEKTINLRDEMFSLIYGKHGLESAAIRIAHGLRRLQLAAK